MLETAFQAVKSAGVPGNEKGPEAVAAGPFV
ncbi:MAG: hypothetical protein ACJARR_003904 [Pseudophaeobacter arcticus]|jgi:hypothetical protein